MTSASTTHWWVPDLSMQVLLNPFCSWHLVRGELPSISTWTTMTHRPWLLCFPKLIHHPSSGPSQGTLPLLNSSLRSKECLRKDATNPRVTLGSLPSCLSLLLSCQPTEPLPQSLSNLTSFCLSCLTSDPRHISPAFPQWYRLNSYHPSPDPNCQAYRPGRQQISIYLYISNAHLIPLL